MVPSTWQFNAPLPPALRRGLFAALPVGVGLLLDLALDVPAAGAVSTGALLAGFVAFDAPARTRLVWQGLTAPVIGAAAALGALTSQPALLAVVAMTLFASVAGITVAVSPRLSIAAMTCVLALLIAQGLSLDAHEAPEALLLGAVGAVLQAGMSGAAWLRDRDAEPLDPVAGFRTAIRVIRANLNIRSRSFRHALRWGTALGIGVAAYHVVDLGEHGFWIPLTVLFVLKPEAGDTFERIAMRAAGTVAGLALATALAAIVGEHPLPDAVVLTIAAGFSFALLAVEYALFTTAITAYVVLLAHALGQSAWQAADERALGTLLGIAIAGLAVVVWRNREYPAFA